MPKLTKRDREILGQAEAILRALPRPVRVAIDADRPVIVSVGEARAGEGLSLVEAVERADP